MLTYDLSQAKAEFLYEYLYACLKADIRAGQLEAGERLPSKRNFAAHLGVSVATVEQAYSGLVDEGYLEAKARSGYYVAKIVPAASSAPTTQGPLPEGAAERKRGWGSPATSHGRTPPLIPPLGGGQASFPAPLFADFTSNHLPPESFPFTAWGKALRLTLAERQKELLQSTPLGGAKELREAIAWHLQNFRGMTVAPAQIIVGAGSEYLYGLLARFLGADQLFALEDPGYGQASRVYASVGAKCCYIPTGERGLSLAALRQSGATVAHVSPSHQFPTGLALPIARRYELLAWASEARGRYIVEDDYDSEFRFVGRPLPTLFSIDAAGRVLYLNTFSKTLTPTLRISYLVLPAELVRPFHEKLGFLACPVSNFEQYTLARFIQDGHFERHLARMRTLYRKKRDLLSKCFRQSHLPKRARLIGQSSGLHFLLELKTAATASELGRLCLAAGIKVSFLSDYCHAPQKAAPPVLLLNYSAIPLAQIPAAVERLSRII